MARSGPFAGRAGAILGGAVLALTPAAVAPVRAADLEADWFFAPDRSELGGYVEGEMRFFPSEPLAGFQHETDGSLALRPEFLFDWGDYSLRFVPFGRIDVHDENRTHADIRELLLTVRGDDWDARFGVGKVFWGVTEGRRVVDIINQTDLVEDPDGREKLGQPMANLALYRDWGTLNLYVLPGFRERTFPAREGRLRTTPRPTNDRAAIYESALEEWNVDVAARWQQTFDDLDVAVSYFHGTTRDPTFSLGFEGAEPVLIPRYDIINQGGLELQYAFGSTLLKGEAFVREGQGDVYAALDVGFEHTLTGVFETAADVGLIGEYLYESRDCCVEDGRIFFNPQQDDILFGARVAFNDEANSSMLATMMIDLENGSKALRLEASRRLGEATRIELEGGAFIDIAPDDPLFTLRRDSYLQLKFQFYF